MDALIPALVAALLAGVGDRPAWLAAVLGDRFERAGPVLAGVVLAQLLVNGVAAFGALLVTPILTPNAKSLMLGMALVFAGAGALMRPRLKDRLEGWKTGPFPTAFLGCFSLALGDRTAFVTFALAARSSLAWPAVAGAAAGCAILAGIAVSLGERQWRALPLRPIGIGAGMVLVVAGLAAAASGLRLI